MKLNAKACAFLFALILCCTKALAQHADPVPAALQHTLDSLKKTNDLTEWLYTRIEYSYGQPQQSLPFLMATRQHAWRMPADAEERQAWMLLLSNQGYNQLLAGNILQSINCYEAAYSYYFKNGIADYDLPEYVLKPLSNNYTRLGDYERAIFIQRKTLDYFYKGTPQKNKDLTSTTLANMAVSYKSMGDLLNAERTIRKGLQLTDTSSPVHILLNNILADILFDKADYEQAAQLINTSIIRLKNIKIDFETAYWLLSAYQTAGNIAQQKGQYEKARSHYQTALKLIDRHYHDGRLRERANIYKQIGKLYLASRQPAAAIGYFDQALQLLIPSYHENTHISTDKIYGENKLIETFYDKAGAYLMLGKQQKALDNILLSLMAADKVRFEFADAITKHRFQKETKLMAEKAMDIAWALYEKTKRQKYIQTILDIAEQTKARTLLDDIRENQQRLTIKTSDTLISNKLLLEKAIAFNERQMLEQKTNTKQLKAINNELKFKLSLLEKQLRTRYPTLLTDAQGQLTQNLHVLEYFMGSRSLYRIEVKAGKAVGLVKIPEAKRLKKEVMDFADRYYHSGPSAMMNQPKVFFAASNKLFRMLFKDFSFSKDQKLVIIPDEALGYLSFDGLITDSNYISTISKWPFLIRKATISYAFSLQTLQRQSQNNNTTVHRAGHNFKGLFLTHERSSRQIIPAVQQEAKAIQKTVAGTYLLDEDASANNFFKAFDESDVLHISTHAYLSGTQQEPTLAFNDKQVFLFELSARKTTPRLVVLSACRTADGLMTSGEGIISLSRGFAAIGTQGTIAGLWNVNDAAAAQITSGMYTHVLAGHPISEALHRSKLHWLSTKRNTEQEYLPYYWDSLIYMGYDQKIDLKPAKSHWLFYGLLAIAMTGLSANYLYRKRKA